LKALESDDPKSDAAQCIFELMDAVDGYVPEPKRRIDKPFLMPIEDVLAYRDAAGGDGPGSGAWFTWG